MNKTILVLRSVLILIVLIFQSVSSYALLDPAEREAREAKKRRLVEATDHTISGSALRDYEEARERRREAEEDVDPEDRPKKGDPIDLEDSSIHPEDEEFFEEKEDAIDDGGPGEGASSEDFDPNKKP